MNQYFFKMSKAERENILDKHKSVYDGYVTEYGKTNNQQPLYVQDLANDKNGITVSNTGNVKHYTNMNINEGHTGSDYIGDGPHDLENGTVDFRGVPDMTDVNREYFHDEYPSPNEDEEEYISVGFVDDDEDDFKSMRGRFFDKEDEEDEWDDDWDDDDDWDYEDDEDDWDDEEEDDKFSNFYDGGFEDDIDKDELPEFIDNLNESLDMFRRIIK